MARCLILACGNTLREDDGIGPFLASWCEERFHADNRVRVIAVQQWTPELSADIAETEFVLFIDCAVNAVPGSVAVTPVEAAAQIPRLLTHHLDAAELLALARDYYGVQPKQALLLSVGAASLELREGFSDVVQVAVLKAQRTLEKTVFSFLTAAHDLSA